MNFVEFVEKITKTKTWIDTVLVIGIGFITILLVLFAMFLLLSVFAFIFLDALRFFATLFGAVFILAVCYYSGKWGLKLIGVKK